MYAQVHDWRFERVRMRPLTAESLNIDGLMLLCEEILRRVGEDYRELLRDEYRPPSNDKQVFDRECAIMECEEFIRYSPITRFAAIDPEEIIRSIRMQAKRESKQDGRKKRWKKGINVQSRQLEQLEPKTRLR